MAIPRGVSPSSNRVRVAAIDTSSDRAGVALFDGVRQRACVERPPQPHRRYPRAARSSSAACRHRARQTGWRGRRDRPGSFSALRVGLSIAKGLVFSLGVPLVGVPTTDAIAAQLAWIDRPVLAVMTAGRGRVVWSRYDGGSLIEGPAIPPRMSCELATEGALVARETDLPDWHRIGALPAGARVEQIARLGWARFAGRRVRRCGLAGADLRARPACAGSDFGMTGASLRHRADAARGYCRGRARSSGVASATRGRLGLSPRAAQSRP